MPEIPVIRLTVESMKHSILTALSEYEMTVAKELRDAVETVCTPEYIQEIMRREVQSVLAQAIRDEVDRYYRHGDGRAAVEQAVHDALHRWDPPSEG